MEDDNKKFAYQLQYLCAVCGFVPVDKFRDLETCPQCGLNENDLLTEKFEKEDNLMKMSQEYFKKWFTI